MAKIWSRILNACPGLVDLKAWLDALHTTVTETRAVVVELHAWAEATATKLNADAGVTDTNYDADISAPDPAVPPAAISNYEG